MDKPPSDQLELFKSRPRTKSKLFHSANGPDLLYWRLQSNKTRIELSDGALIDVSRQSPGRSGHPRLYTKVPGQDGIVQARNLKTILAQIALLDRIRAINKSIQIKLKQQDDAARILADLTKDTATDATEKNGTLRAELDALKKKSGRLEDENAKLRQELQAANGPEEAAARRAQSINVRALQWALNQRDLSAPGHHVLLILAIHSDERGYTWPGVRRIASISGQDPGTVRKGIEALLVRRKIFRTKKRKGSTLQVKVYRLPRIAYERRGKSTVFEKDESDGKGEGKEGGSPGKFASNKEYRIKEELLVNRKKAHSSARSGRVPPAIEQATRLYCEEQLLGRLSAIVRPSEIIKNEPMWRARAKASPQAIIDAIREYYRLPPEKRDQIQNPAAWMTEQYRRHGGQSVAKSPAPA